MTADVLETCRAIAQVTVTWRTSETILPFHSGNISTRRSRLVVQSSSPKQQTTGRE